MVDFYFAKKKAMDCIKKYLAQTEPEKRDFNDLSLWVMSETGMGDKFITDILKKYHMKVSDKGMIESEI